MNSLADLTCLIPLYKSGQFLRYIIQNIDDHLKRSARILVSDRHMLDDTAEVLKLKYNHDDRVTVFTQDDAINWVDHINFLIDQAETAYIRFVPHDDIVPASSSEILVRSLDTHREAIASIGIVKAIDVDGKRMPEKDSLNVQEDRNCKDWSFSDSMEFVWKYRFGQAFKGVIRLRPIRERNLRIRKTPHLFQSDRLWMFALTLLGRFQFEPEAYYFKRYHTDSTHRQWKVLPEYFLHSAEVMTAYCEELIKDEQRLKEARFLIYHNMLAMTRFRQTMIGAEPTYLDIVPGH